MASPIISRSHHPISRHVHRAGCPCDMIPYYQVSKQSQDKRTALVNQYTTMRLVHMGKDQKIKNSLRLDYIHDVLCAESLPLSQSGSSNILLSVITFDCLIETVCGKQIREALLHKCLVDINSPYPHSS